MTPERYPIYSSIRTGRRRGVVRRVLHSVGTVIVWFLILAVLVAAVSLTLSFLIGVQG